MLSIFGVRIDSVIALRLNTGGVHEIRISFRSGRFSRWHMRCKKNKIKMV